MKTTFITIRNFVRRNKAALAVGAIATTVVALQLKGTLEVNEFLKEKNLFDEYYHLES